MGASHSEFVIWRDGNRRCELWTIEGREGLRVFDGDAVMFHEGTFPDVCYIRGWHSGIFFSKSTVDPS